MAKSLITKIVGVVKDPHLPWFVLKWIRRINPRLYKKLHYGNANPNTEEYWSRRYDESEIKEETFYDEFYKALAPRIPDGAKVLDLGCGTGNILEKLRDCKGCRCTGIDISRKAIEIVTKKGFTGYVGELPAVPPGVADDAPFDVCVFNEVLEHVDDPVAVVNAAVTAATPEIILITVPNDSMKPHEHDEHLHAFTRESLDAEMDAVPGYDGRSRIVSVGREEYLLYVAERAAGAGG